MQDELIRLGHRIAASTVWQILHEARRRAPTSAVRFDLETVLHRSAKAALAVNFRAWDTVVLRRIYALIAVKHGSRRAHLVGVSAQSTG